MLYVKVQLKEFILFFSTNHIKYDYYMHFFLDIIKETSQQIAMQ